MSETDKNRQMIISISAMIFAVILAMLKLINGELAFGAISSVLTYNIGRYIPYNGGLK